MSDHVSDRWEKWKEDVMKLAGLQIPRCVKPSNFGQVVKAELHTFSDACEYGYGAICYLKMWNSDGRLCVAFLMSKARVAPVNTKITIPRLELCAAVLGMKLSRFVLKELQLQIDVKPVYWVDSQVVLGYINNEAARDWPRTCENV